MDLTQFIIPFIIFSTPTGELQVFTNFPRTEYTTVEDCAKGLASGVEQISKHPRFEEDYANAKIKVTVCVKGPEATEGVDSMEALEAWAKRTLVK